MKMCDLNCYKGSTYTKLNRDPDMVHTIFYKCMRLVEQVFRIVENHFKLRFKACNLLQWNLADTISTRTGKQMKYRKTKDFTV